MDHPTPVNEHSKEKDLAAATTADDRALTTSQGQPISEDQNSLRAGVRGPTLMEDHLFREKIQHFDQERIPERVVHARGAGAHGYFQVYRSLAEYTRAKVLQDPAVKTPAFVRFSTVVGSRGSADTARDVRGFAVKLYTEEGIWDIVGNNIPVFFIQDAVKFPDLIHAAKPEPHNEIPQAATAHDTFWDFISLTPESMHMILWIMSDRAIPRSFRMMEGFGVNTFRFVNAAGKARFVKFHWKPKLGVHSLVWDEAQKIAGRDPDFHRRDLWEAIDRGSYPEWELAVQVIDEGEEGRFDFDVLDATKIWPEDVVPLEVVGKLTLNRNPDNFFAETEQVAFCTQNVVPGIDFSDDPLLQGRNFSYLDTQLKRLGTPNFSELPINRPVTPVSNNQRDAQMRHTINKGRVSYTPASLDGHSPEEATPGRGFATYPAEIHGPKVRQRSPSFGDHYGQARLFWNSVTPPEREHIVKALQFELSRVDSREVRVRMLNHLQRINDLLAAQVALALGEFPQTSLATAQPGGTADSPDETKVLAAAVSPTSASGGVQSTKGLSMEEDQPASAGGRKVAILAAAGVAAGQVRAIREALRAEGAEDVVIGPHLGRIEADDGSAVEAGQMFASSSSVLFDALYVPGGARSAETLLNEGDARLFIEEAYKHGKPVAASNEGIDVVVASEIGYLPQASGADLDALAAQGVLLAKDADMRRFAQDFIAAVAAHRFWNRKQVGFVAA
jgi:catalase